MLTNGAPGELSRDNGSLPGKRHRRYIFALITQVNAATQDRHLGTGVRRLARKESTVDKHRRVTPYRGLESEP